jgi:hypothetical protein
MQSCFVGLRPLISTKAKRPGLEVGRKGRRPNPWVCATGAMIRRRLSAWQKRVAGEHLERNDILSSVVLWIVEKVSLYCNEAA